MKTQTAHDAYTAKRNELITNLAKLQAHIEIHAARESTDRRNYGYVGDLAYINQLVLRALGEEV